MTASDFENDRDAVLDILCQAEAKFSAQAFIQEIKKKLSVSTQKAKKKLKQLIDEQELSYHYLYGSTYIEKSFLKPVRVSKHFILKPPGFSSLPKKNDHEIIIEQGISFGSGQHPTTQLCLEAIDLCLLEKQMVHKGSGFAGADIGTGSGVLAIAMCKAGLMSCKAYEIDPVSVNEAKKNVKLNSFEMKIEVIQDKIKPSENQVSVITANLRFPTLKAISNLIFSGLKKNGIVILSGVRTWERELLVSHYSDIGFDLVWQKDRKNWSAFVLEKKL